ncbi:TniB family NTP-binding protein [Mitsuaria sp. BK037]|uniref:TniB family NTP-binding protein n=1 Tax=Mitsuaria sp. BK037 TaxID=2587122 RepID=UPI00161EDE90|nr:TniB family NTP-binding protein [Mitsuaria sp. BK037]
MALHVIDTGDQLDDDDENVQARRMSMYSPRAIKAARSLSNAYILFPQIKAALAAFDRVYQLSRDVAIPQGVLLIGPPGSSKTSAAHYFMQSLPPASDVVDGFGALYVRMRPGATAGLIVSQVLNAVRHPFTNVRHDRLAPMRDIACEALQHKGTRLLFVDEAQSLTQRGRGRVVDERDTSAANMLREIMDRAGIGLVLLADQRLPGLDHVDRALADRVSVRLSLSHFDNDAAWAAFLTGLTRCVDQPSMKLFANTAARAATHTATAGSRRATMRLVVEALLIAVDAEAAEVTQAHLQLAFQRTRGPGHELPNPYGNA